MNITEVKKSATTTKILRIFERVHELWVEYGKEVVAFMECFVLTFAKLGPIRPFGLALFCSYSGAGREKLFAFLGVAFASIFLENGIFIVIGALVSLALTVLFVRKGREGVFEKIAEAAAASIAFLPEGAVGVAVALTGLPAFSAAFAGITKKGQKIYPFLADSGFLCMVLAFSLAFKSLSLGYFSFGIIAAAFLCIEGCERGGYFLGALSGFFGGLALGIYYVPVFVLGGIFGGILIRRKRFWGIFTFAMTCIISSFFVLSGKELGTFLFSALWGCILWAAVSSLILDRKRIKMPLFISEGEIKEEKKLSDAIGSISVALSGVSRTKRREREEKTRTVVDGIFSMECDTCSGCTLPVEATKSRICECMIKNRKVTQKDFSESFRERCSRWSFICEKANEVLDEHPQKTGIRIDTLAEDYMAMSRLLALGERRSENRYCRDILASNKIKSSLELKNIRVSKVEVVGTRLPKVEISGIPFKLPFPEKIIKRETEKILGKEVFISLLETEGKNARIKMKAVCPLKVEFYKVSVPKKGEIICGDSISFFETDEGFFYSVISDGMGSGRDAAVCSRLGTVFLEKLISAGIDKGGAVSMLGNVIASSEDEVFTTVDLVEIDMVRGKITSIKAGAAPTWIVRGERAYSISSKTLPCGIISGTFAEQTVVDCFSGDIVIMGSDGGECGVSDVIGRITRSKNVFSPKEIALMLADESYKKGERGDDVSFCVMSIL